MSEETYILYDNQDLSRIGLTTLILSQTKNAQIFSVSGKNKLKKSLESNAMACVILDYEYSDFEEVNEILHIKNMYSNSTWLFISNTISDKFIHQLTDEIPDANFVLKTDSDEDILAAITSTISKKRFYCSEALNLILGFKSRKKEEDNKFSPIHRLTTTEIEIAQLIAYGKSSKEIAEERCLSFHTVNTHRKNIFRKLGVTTEHDLTKLALKYGLVDLTEYYI